MIKQHHKSQGVTLVMHSSINLTTVVEKVVEKQGKFVWVKRAPTEQGFSKAPRTGGGVKQTYRSGEGG